MPPMSRSTARADGRELRVGAVMAAMFCKVRIRIAWNFGRPEFIEAGPFREDDAFEEAGGLYRRLTAEIMKATERFPKRVNVELFDYHAEEIA